jgi:hypothetical protein
MPLKISHPIGSRDSGCLTLAGLQKALPTGI